MSIRDEARREYVRRAVGPSVGTIGDRLSAAWDAGASWERDAIFQSRDTEGKRGEVPTESIVTAVLPIAAEEVRKAKAEALREAARDIDWSAETLPHMTPHDAARGLVRRADRIETGDPR